MTPILSGAFLFTALYLIRKSVGNNSQVNIKAMTLHATSFGLYMASVLLWLCFYYMDENYTYLGITYICASLSQAVLCIIFWDLGKKRKPQQREKLPEDTENSVKDENEDDEAWIKRKKANKIPLTEE